MSEPTDPFSLTGIAIIDAISAHDRFKADAEGGPLININKNLVNLIQPGDKIRDQLSAADTPELIVAQNSGSSQPWVPHGPLDCSQSYLVAITTDKQSFQQMNELRWEIMKAIARNPNAHRLGGTHAMGYSFNWSDVISEDAKIGNAYVFPQSARGAFRCLGVISINVPMRFNVNNLRGN